MEIEKITLRHSRVGWVILSKEENSLTRYLRLPTEKVVSERLFEESERNRMGLKKNRGANIKNQSITSMFTYFLPSTDNNLTEKNPRETHIKFIHRPPLGGLFPRESR